LAQKFPHLALILEITNRRRVGDPQVDLKPAIALVPEFSDPAGDAVRRCGYRSEPAHATRICHRAREAGGAGAGHRRLQYWYPQPEAPAESGGALSRDEAW
jgi:hypothetical protein